MANGRDKSDTCRYDQRAGVASRPHCGPRQLIEGNRLQQWLEDGVSSKRSFTCSELKDSTSSSIAAVTGWNLNGAAPRCRGIGSPWTATPSGTTPRIS